MSYSQLLKRMWPYMQRHLGLFIGIVVSILLLAAVARLLPQVIGYAIDEGIKNKQASAFVKAAWIYLAFEILKTVSQFCSQYLFQIFGNRILFYIRQDLIQHIQRLPVEFYNKTSTGRIITRVTNDVATLGELFTQGLVSIFINFMVLLTIVIAMLLISPLLTLATLFATPIFIFLAVKLTKKLRQTLFEQKSKLSTINSFVAENLNGIKVIQLYNRLKRNRKIFARHTEEYSRLTLKNIHVGALMAPIMNVFTAMTVSIALFYGGYLSLENAIGIGSLIAFLMHAQDFIPPLREIIEKYQQFQNSLTSAERVFQMMDEPEEVEKEESLEANFTGRTKGHIEIRNLSYQYRSDLPFVIKNLSIEIPHGKSLAIVGRTGSGKSTLIALLQRFYDAPKDSIFIDHVPIETIPRSDLRRTVGVCQQDNFIFKGSLLENIRLFDESLSQTVIDQALEEIGYADVLRRTGRDLNLQIEEKGANLSAGERQLIAFARVLVFNPPILILDEATANIDSESELLIQNATQKLMKNRTCIIIAHRLSTIQNCDQIMVLENGSKLELGSHQELMALKGRYYQLSTAGLKSTEILA